MNLFKALTQSKLFVPGVFVCVGVVIITLASYWTPRDVAKECFEKCKTVNRFSRLVPQYPSQMVVRGKQTPMLCECY